MQIARTIEPFNPGSKVHIRMACDQCASKILASEDGSSCGGGAGKGVWTRVGLSVGCFTSQQHASVSQGRVCSDNCTCCHTEIEVADQTFHLTQSQYTDTGPTSPSTDPITPGAWQGSHWSANV